MDPEVIKKYEFTLKLGTYVFPGFGEIDLYRLTLKKADELHEKGFKWMKLRKQYDSPARQKKQKPQAD